MFNRFYLIESLSISGLFQSSEDCTLNVDDQVYVGILEILQFITFCISKIAIKIVCCCKVNQIMQKLSLSVKTRLSNVDLSIKEILQKIHKDSIKWHLLLMIEKFNKEITLLLI